MSNTLRTIVIAIVLLACGVIAEAQQPKKIPRIVYLSTADTGANTRLSGIRRRLRELGYIEGQNITIEHRIGGTNVDRYREVATELARLKVDMIVVGSGTVYVQAVKNATKTIPIVMTGAGVDPVEAGVIESLARPGGNVTGITNLARDLGGKRLELLKEAAPKLLRVAILYNPADKGHAQEMKKVLLASASALKLTLQPWEIKTSDGFEKAAFAAMAKQRPDGLYALGGPLINANLKSIVDFALKNRLPLVSGGGREEDVDSGALIYYGADVEDTYRQAAWYIDKILKGTNPADLPVQQPRKFEFVINLKTAKQIGLEIPQWTLMKADRVIK